MRVDFDIKKERRAEMVSVIKDYFLRELEEEIGDLRASLILDFFMEKLAIDFYNKGVHDAYKHMTRLVEDILALQIF